MESGAKVMINGVQVGRVSGVTGGREPAELKVDIDADQAHYIPANVGAQIRATTAFGAKYVDLIYPDDPSAARLSAGAVLTSRNVTTEVNTVFENLVGLLDQIDPAKLNAVLGALSEGFRGQGERIGQAITDANQVLLAVNPRSETIRQDWRAFKGFSDAYGAAADDIVAVLDAASTTSSTITGHAAALDTLLLNTIGFAQAGTNLLAPNQQNLIDAINILEPTTNLLMKYDPVLTCTLVGAKWFLDDGALRPSAETDARTYPTRRSCSATTSTTIPRICRSWPPRAARVANPAAGRCPTPRRCSRCASSSPTPGGAPGSIFVPTPASLRKPCYANFLPVTRAVPEPPSIRECLPGPGDWSRHRTRYAAVRGAAVRTWRGAAVAGTPAGRNTTAGAGARHARRATGGLRSAAATVRRLPGPPTDPTAPAP